MGKILVIATREYRAIVGTKAFLIAIITDADLDGRRDRRPDIAPRSARAGGKENHHSGRQLE